MDLLKKLCSIHAPSGEEGRIKDFLISYINKEMVGWKSQPEIISEGIHDNLILKFGQPATAIFCHVDSVGFSLQYDKKLIPIGSPVFESELKLIGEDIHGELREVKGFLSDADNEKHDILEDDTFFGRGTAFTFAPDFTHENDIITSPFLDNRAGVWLCLKLAETLENGLIVFTTYEENGGGSAEFLAPMIYQKYGITEALICDMTWTTSHVVLGQGPVLSLRDKYIPRKKFIDKITGLLNDLKIPFQKEVESSGSSDGGYIQKSSVPMDWCFIGASIEEIHSHTERIHSGDLKQTLDLYSKLMHRLHPTKL